MRKAGLGETEKLKGLFPPVLRLHTESFPKILPWLFANCSACQWSCLISPFVSRLDQRDTQYGHDILKTKVTSFSPYLHCCSGLLSLRHFLEGAGWMWSFKLHVNSLACLSLFDFIFSQWSLMFYNCLFSCGLSQAFCFYFLSLNKISPLLEMVIQKKKGM